MPAFETWWETAFYGVFAFVFGNLVLQWLGRGKTPDLEEGDTIADLGAIEVTRLDRDGHARAVGIVFWVSRTRCVACLKPREARHLAQVLRVACAPGRNMAQARFNAKRRETVA